MNFIFAAVLLLMALLCVYAILGPMRLHLLTETGLALIGVVCLGMAFTLWEGSSFDNWRSITTFGLGGLFLVFWGLHRQKAQNDAHPHAQGFR